MPSNRKAGELYSNGLVKLRAYDAMAARTFLEQSIAAEPSFPLAHSALSDAWARLGYDQRAEEEAQKAYDLSSSLLPTERLQVQARYWEAKGEWDKAAEAYRSLYARYPDDPEYAVALAGSLTRAGKGKDALALLEPRRKELGSAKPGSKAEENAKIDLAIADAALALGDLERASQAAEAAASTARAQGQVLVAARALRTQGMVLESLKHYDKAMAVTEQARQIYTGASDRFGVASVLEVQADVLSDRGDLAGALDKYQQELNTVREVGYKRGQASALNNIGLVLNQPGAEPAGRPGACARDVGAGRTGLRRVGRQEQLLGRAGQYWRGSERPGRRGPGQKQIRKGPGALARDE
jgi:tetratricopeptide (TPR) repeat protein